MQGFAGNISLEEATVESFLNLWCNIFIAEIKGTLFVRTLSIFAIFLRRKTS